MPPDGLVAVISPFILWTIDQVASPDTLEAWTDVVMTMVENGIWELEIAGRVGALRIRKPE